MHAPRVRRRLIPAVLVILVLALVPALSAHAFPLDLTLQAHGVWWQVVNTFAQVWVKGESERAPAGALTKEGAGISPLGASTEVGESIDSDGTSTNADSATEPAGAFTEAGAGISPLG